MVICVLQSYAPTEDKFPEIFKRDRFPVESGMKEIDESNRL